MRILSVVVTLIALVAAIGVVNMEPATLDADVLKAGEGRKWFRGNLHTHSHWSDGDDYLEMIALWYRDQGYDFLSFTDHNVLANTERWVTVDKTKGGRKAYDKLKAQFPDWVEERTRDGRLEVRLRTFEEVFEKISVPDEFLLIQGEEISDRFERYPIHMNVNNVVEAIPPMGGGSVYETLQNNVNAALAQRERTGQPMIIHLNHPNFGYAVTAEDLMKVQGEKFFEVYNGHPGVHNSGDHHHVSVERLWDVVLAHRLGILGLPVMYGLAVDDGHNYHNIPSRASEPGRGWVMVLANELTPESLIDALEAGRFYASSGVALRQVMTSPKRLMVEVDPQPGATYTIEFIGTRKGFNPVSQPIVDDNGKEMHATHHYGDDIGTVLARHEGPSAQYVFEGDELYVRARITSSTRHPNPSEPGEFERAWTQPVVGPAAIPDRTR